MTATKSATVDATPTIPLSAQSDVLALLNITADHGVVQVLATVDGVTVTTQRYGLKLPVLIAQALGLDPSKIKRFTIDPHHVTVTRVNAAGIEEDTVYKFASEEVLNG